MWVVTSGLGSMCLSNSVSYLCSFHVTCEQCLYMYGLHMYRLCPWKQKPYLYDGIWWKLCKKNCSIHNCVSTYVYTFHICIVSVHNAPSQEHSEEVWSCYFWHVCSLHAHNVMGIVLCDQVLCVRDSNRTCAYMCGSDVLKMNFYSGDENITLLTHKKLNVYLIMIHGASRWISPWLLETLVAWNIPKPFCEIWNVIYLWQNMLLLG